MTVGQNNFDNKIPLCSKLGKNVFFDQITNFFSFSTEKYIGEKIGRFVFEKLVITCRELDTDSDQPQQGPLFHSVIYKASDVVHPTASPTSEDGSSEVMYTLYVLCRYLPTKPPVQSIMSHSHATVFVFLIFSGHFC